MRKKAWHVIATKENDLIRKKGGTQYNANIDIHLPFTLMLVTA